MWYFTVAVNMCAGLVFGYATPPGDGGNCQAKMTALPIDPGSKCCTQASGHATELVQHPWAAVIEYKNEKTGLTKRLCAGSLISGKYVLTSGHCITGLILDIGTPTAVRLGEYNLSNDGSDCVPTSGGGEDCNDKAVSIEIESTIAHPKFYYPDNPSIWNDIGLIRLKKAAPYTDFIRPICLPTRNPESNPPDNPFYAVGWNNKTVKGVFKMPFVKQEKCKSLELFRKIVFGEGQLCAGGIEGMDPCTGDGGGPLVYENKEGLSEVTGIVSFGANPCGRKDIPSVFTNVYEYLDWIKTNIKP